MNIKFIASDRKTEIVVDPPSPAKTALPNWYKDTPRFLNGDGPEFSGGAVSNNSVKACLPFYDSMISGYIQKTWCDIHVKFNYDDCDNLIDFSYNYARGPKIIDHRNHVAIPLSEDFHKIEFTWKIPWIPIMPKGWSCLFTFPMNRTDLPFWSPSGIIDSDNFYHIFEGNYPTYIKKSFNNKIIPAGTPMYQIVPIKRESWNSETKHISDEERTILESKKRSFFMSSYKKLFHQKKIF